jgi:hypothetical protein
MTTTQSGTPDGAAGTKAFQPRLGVVVALTAAALAFALGADWPEALIGLGLGFIVGGAARLLAGIWPYLAVFFALVGGFVWLLVHYIVK